MDLKNSLITHIVDSVGIIRKRHSNPAFVMSGDFNNLDTRFLLRSTDFIYIHSAATRGNNVLDKIFISRNCNKFYHHTADILPPLGNSDDCCVFMQSVLRNQLPPIGFNTVFKRNFNNCNLDVLAFNLSSADWRPLF